MAPSADSTEQGEFVEDVLMILLSYLYLVSTNQKVAYASISIYLVGIVVAFASGSPMYSIMFLGGVIANLWIYKYGDFPEPVRAEIFD